MTSKHDSCQFYVTEDRGAGLNDSIESYVNKRSSSKNKYGIYMESTPTTELVQKKLYPVANQTVP